MALPENAIGYSDAIELMPEDTTDEVIDRLHGRDMEDAVFWSALRGAARPPEYRRQDRYPDLSNDDELFAAVMNDG
jgi:hypothetical protein